MWKQWWLFYSKMLLSSCCNGVTGYNGTREGDRWRISHTNMSAHLQANRPIRNSEQGIVFVLSGRFPLPVHII